MSFEINNEISDLDKIYYNYPTYKIYKTQYEKTLENGGYIKKLDTQHNQIPLT